MLTAEVAWASIWPYITAKYILIGGYWYYVAADRVLLLHATYGIVVDRDCVLDYSDSAGHWYYELTSGQNTIVWYPTTGPPSDITATIPLTLIIPGTAPPPPPEGTIVLSASPFTFTYTGATGSCKAALTNIGRDGLNIVTIIWGEMDGEWVSYDPAFDSGELRQLINGDSYTMIHTGPGTLWELLKDITITTEIPLTLIIPSQTDITAEIPLTLIIPSPDVTAEIPLTLIVPSEVDVTAEIPLTLIIPSLPPPPPDDGDGTIAWLTEYWWVVVIGIIALVAVTYGVTRR